MKIAISQFAVSRDWQENAAVLETDIARAHAEGCGLLVGPEGVLARDITDRNIKLTAAQPLDGPFMQRCLHASANAPGLTVIFCIHTPAPQPDMVHNTLVAFCDGEITATYRKLHLYDAFSDRESRAVLAGTDIPPLLDVHGFKIGLMTCYDIRFPELARHHALAGADALVLPSAWVKGPGKERHWEVLVTARALDTTCYMIAPGESGPNNIGASLIVDPLGVAVARSGHGRDFLRAELSHARVKTAREKLPVLLNSRFGLSPLLSE